jgi:hypothetical protein
MRPEKDLNAAQYTTEWVQKFTLLLTFLALKEIETVRESIISKITNKIRQSS